MANGGELKGTRLLSESTMESFHAEPIERDMSFDVNYFVKGGVSFDQPLTVPKPHPPKMIPNDIAGCYGWIGYGGSVIQWHRELKIGFGFVPTFLYYADLNNVRGKNLLSEVIRCAKLKAARDG